MKDVFYDFLYDGQRLSEYGFVVCSFDNSSDETISIGNSLTFNTFKSPNSDKNIISSSTYEEPLTFTIQICKNFCTNKKLIEVTYDEQSKLLRWLGRRENHEFRIIDDSDTVSDLHYNGSFNNFQEYKIGGKVYGFEITLNTDSPYAYLDLVTEYHNMSYNYFSPLACSKKDTISKNKTYTLPTKTYGSGTYTINYTSSLTLGTDINIFFQLDDDTKYSILKTNKINISKGEYTPKLIIEYVTTPTSCTLTNFSMTETTALIENISDEIGILYPETFSCKCGSSGTLEITNSIESTRKTIVKNCVNDETISMSGSIKNIESDVATHSKLYNDFNYNYFRLNSTYNKRKNNITTSIPCEIEFTYYPIRKVGVRS